MSRVEHMSAEHLADLKGRAERRFAVIDKLPPAIRALIHEHSWRTVKAFLDAGITDSRKIRHLIGEVREGSGCRVGPHVGSDP